MERLSLRHNVAQFLIEIMFGVALLTPLIYGVTTGNLYSMMLIAIGVAFGYSLHVAQKMLLYEELLSEEVKDQVETEVAEKVPQEAQKEVEKEVEKQVNEPPLEPGKSKS